MQNVISVIVIVGFFMIAIWVHVLDIRKRLKDGKQRQHLRDVEDRVNSLVSLYFQGQMDHLATPSVWIFHISKLQTPPIPEEVISGFLIRMQDYTPIYQCSVDWDGPNMVKVTRQNDWQIMLDRSKNEFVTRYDDIMYVTSDEFEKMKPIKFSRVR